MQRSKIERQQNNFIKLISAKEKDMVQKIEKIKKAQKKIQNMLTDKNQRRIHSPHVANDKLSVRNDS